MGKLHFVCIILMLIAVPRLGSQEQSSPTASSQVSVSSVTAAPDSRTNLEKFADPSPLVRRNAVIMLGTEKKKGNVPMLIKMLEDPVVEVQRAAINALAITGDKRAVAPLTGKFTNEKNVNVKMNIIIALGELQSPSSLPLLKGLMKDTYPIYRSEALRALAKMNSPDTYDAIVAMLGDEAEGVRIMAADVAVQLKLSSAEPLLVKNLSDPVAAVRRACAAALGDTGSISAIPDLQKLLGDKDKSVAAAAQGSIAKIETRKSSEPPAPVQAR